MSKREARRHGLTHNALLYGLLPCYAGDLLSDAPLLEFKHPVFAAAEKVVAPLYMLACHVSGREPMFGIQLRGEIGDAK
ncbi:hypothetical protein [uncultured Kushneria sp.]|uniref:hypothetical protein n=1 Tax=uncultured Kushneria sp. TaxID=905033 RepID=UPI002603D0F1|nr:hypothetical protein [uncultured Kushneria sp.]